MCKLNFSRVSVVLRRLLPFSGKASSVGIACLLASCATAQPPPASSQKVTKEFYTSADRTTAIQSATLFSPKAVSEANILEGAPQDKSEYQLHPGDKVICDFATPGNKMGGKTEKFGCKVTRIESANGEAQTVNATDDDPVKVKYGANDNEVYAEVAASRLMWALGYYADSWYPVKVECHNCPSDVQSGNGAKSTRMFDPAIMVHKIKGHKMYEIGNEDEGWSWKELAQVNGRPTYEKDGLALLGAFLVHSDNKPQQQRLVCDHVNVDQSSNPFKTTCDHSMMVVQDVGATFGTGGLFTSNDSAKMNFDGWSNQGLWKKVGKGGSDCPQCQARLRKSLTAKDGLDDPMVSEEGRRFLAGLMCQLTDKQIEDLFRIARVAQMPKYHNSDGSFKSGVTEDSVVQQWVGAFKKKREELAAGRCAWKTQPTDLTIVDNPAHLPNVPNFCSAKPF